MNKTIIVSNRLPLQISIDEDQLVVTPSVGGLATGMNSVHGDGKGVWVGWTGISEDELSPELSKKVESEIRAKSFISVPLLSTDIKDYYEGFSNKTLWPLFHYFMEYSIFQEHEWEAYRQVNIKFAKVVLDNLEDGDTVWVHDYQLLLLPQLIKDQRPNTKIGFFLHIPFPSFEIFRTFPRREEILRGMLGADLIGFHTYDYERHFLSSIKRIIRLDVNFNNINFHDRVVSVGSFPMGIDYDRFHNAATKNNNEKKEQAAPSSQMEGESTEHIKIILSIDRMDYTKGLPNRIKAFEYFLDTYPEYKGKVRLVMLVVPSRSNVSQYKKLKRRTDELVGRINSKFATLSWIPISYLYRSVPFDDLIGLYTSSDVALITPLRDGMNLVAKEFVATRTNLDGVLILSEMAGAAKEMNEALLINPLNFEDVARNLNRALTMPLKEQQTRIAFMQKRLKRYNVEKWATEFLTSLKGVEDLNNNTTTTKKLLKEQEDNLVNDFHKKNKRLLLLDYDGTLVGFKDNPQDAEPNDELYSLLDSLREKENTTVVLISGRDRETFQKWFGHKHYTLVTDHGVWLYQDKEWIELERLKTDWMENIRPILETFVDRTPGTFIETKNYSLAWHYRTADPELATRRTIELNTVLTSMVSNNDLSILMGNKVIEIKSSNVNKGRAVSRLLLQEDYDFITVIGDDWTDEYMFEEVPDWAYSIKVGFAKTKARFRIKNTDSVRQILKRINEDENV